MVGARKIAVEGEMLLHYARPAGYGGNGDISAHRVVAIPYSGAAECGEGVHGAEIHRLVRCRILRGAMKQPYLTAGRTGLFKHFHRCLHLFERRHTGRHYDFSTQSTDLAQIRQVGDFA